MTAKLSADELATLQRLAEGAPATAPSLPVKVSSIVLLRLLARVREAEWQPIETAPKDGTPVLVWLREYKGRDRFTSYVAQFDGYSWVSMPGKYTWTPTHWQPLPPPPAREGSEG